MDKSMSAQHTPGPLRVEVKPGTPMDTVFLKAGKDRVVTYRHASYADKTRANFNEIARRWNAFEQPFGWFCELVHVESGEVIRDTFTRGAPLEGPDPNVTGFAWRATPVAAITKAGGAA